MGTNRTINTIRLIMFGISLGIIQMLILCILIDATDLIEFRFRGARNKYAFYRSFVVGIAILLTMFGTITSKSPTRNASVFIFTSLGSFGVTLLMLFIAAGNAISGYGFRDVYINKSNPDIRIISKANISEDGSAHEPTVKKAEPFLYYFCWLTPIHLNEINKDEWTWVYQPVIH